MEYFLIGALLVAFAWFLRGRYNASKRRKVNGRGGADGGPGSQEEE